MRSSNPAPDLPPLQARWIARILPGDIPRESKADCGDCVLCPGRGAEPAEAFAPDTRCCTFIPAIPNFLVGRALTDPELGEGRRSLDARITAGPASPLGLGVSEDDQERYRLVRAAGLFGKPGAGLRCPHLRDGLCGIWRHRPSTCATWFCRHERGSVGREFWMSLRRLLTRIEDALSVRCALRVGLPADALAALLPEDGSPDLARAWGPWRGREAEFYGRCAVEVEGLDVLQAGGAAVEALAEIVRGAYGRLTDPALPSRVAAGEFRMSRLSERIRLRGYSPSDWIDVPPAWLDRLLELEAEDATSFAKRLGAS